MTSFPNLTQPFVISGLICPIGSNSYPPNTRLLSYAIGILSWLQAGLVPEQLPVSNQIKNLVGKAFEFKDRLQWWNNKCGKKQSLRKKGTCALGLTVLRGKL